LIIHAVVFAALHTQGDENSLERVMNFRIARTHKNGPTRQNTIWKQGKTNFQSVLDAYRLVFSTLQAQGSENSMERAMDLRVARTQKQTNATDNSLETR
jgi:Tfp pilus assembly pilus retraction ATPase PilT